MKHQTTYAAHDPAAGNHAAVTLPRHIYRWIGSLAADEVRAYTERQIIVFLVYRKPNLASGPDAQKQTCHLAG